MKISIYEAITSTLPSNVGDKKYNRNELPQLKLPDLKNNPKLEIESGSVRIDAIKPVQSQRVPGLAKDVAKNFEGKDKPFILDKDNYLVNGHHRYDAARMLGYEVVPAIRIKNKTIEELIDLFPNTTSNTPVVDEDVEIPRSIY